MIEHVDEDRNDKINLFLFEANRFGFNGKLISRNLIVRFDSLMSIATFYSQIILIFSDI